MAVVDVKKSMCIACRIPPRPPIHKTQDPLPFAAPEPPHSMVSPASPGKLHTTEVASYEEKSYLSEVNPCIWGECRSHLPRPQLGS